MNQAENTNSDRKMFRFLSATVSVMFRCSGRVEQVEFLVVDSGEMAWSNESEFI